MAHNGGNVIMKDNLNILILGASYGSLLGTKLAPNHAALEANRYLEKCCGKGNVDALANRTYSIHDGAARPHGILTNRAKKTILE